MEESHLIHLAAVVVLGIGAQWLAWRLRLPSILLLLLAGFVAGPLTGFLDPDRLFGEVLFPIVSLSVGLILFEGGMSLKIAELRAVGGAIRNLLLIGPLVTWALGSAAAVFLLGLDWPIALLLGAILVVTGPTVITPLLRQVRPTAQVASILKWEGILIDPVGATLALLVFEAILFSETGGAASAIVGAVVKTIGAGGAAGAVGAILLTQTLKRYWIPDYLQSPVALMVAVGVFAASNLMQEESGLLADVNWANITAARLAGLDTYFGSILSEQATEEIELGGIGRLVALTANDEVNSLAAIHFAEVFGRAKVYQLPSFAEGEQDRPGHARTLRGRLLFGPDLTCYAINGLAAQGATIKTTPLTEEFDYESYRAHYGEAAIPLMLITPDKRLRLFTTEDPPKPEPGEMVVSLIKASEPPRT